MKVFSEEIIFQRTVWTTESSTEFNPDRSSPCPPSSSNSLNPSLPFRPVLPPLCSGPTSSHENNQEDTAGGQPRTILEPMPTFTNDWRREFLTSPPSSPLSSPFRSLSPLPSPAFGGIGLGPMGLGTPGGEKNEGMQEDLSEPIHLAPIRILPSEVQQDREMPDIKTKWYLQFFFC